MKKGRRRIRNDLSKLKTMFENYFKVTVSVVDPSTLSTAQQIQTMRDAAVVLSPCGGVSFLTALFMQPRTVRIIVDYWDPESKYSSEMEAF